MVCGVVNNVVAGLNYIILYFHLLIILALVSGLIYTNSLRDNIQVFDMMKYQGL